MTPRQLKYFVEIARCGSVTAAASNLHIAQPSLSHHIALLEEELGAPVLKRHARGVRITPAGERLLDRAISILNQIDRLKDDVSVSSPAPRGTVRLCIAEALASSLVPSLIRKIGGLYPDIRLEFTGATSIDARRLIESRRIDLAVIPNAVEITGLESAKALEESFSLFASRSLLKGAGTTITLAQAVKMPLVAPNRDHDLRRHLERVAAANGLPYNVQYELNSGELARALVRDGLACAIWPSYSWPEMALDKNVVKRKIIRPGITRTQSVVWFDTESSNSAAHAVREALMPLFSRFAV